MDTFGTIRAKEHWIKLTKDGKPSFQQTHRAVPEKRRLQEEEIETMSNFEVIEPATPEWATSALFTPKKNSALSFYVDYHCLNVVSVNDSYAIPQMN